MECWKAFTNTGYVSSILWQSLLAGTLCAAVFGFLSLRLILRSVKKGKLYPFAVYLILLAAALAAIGFFC